MVNDILRRFVSVIVACRCRICEQKRSASGYCECWVVFKECPSTFNCTHWHAAEKQHGEQQHGGQEEGVNIGIIACMNTVLEMELSTVDRIDNIFS